MKLKNVIGASREIWHKLAIDIAIKILPFSGKESYRSVDRNQGRNDAFMKQLENLVSLQTNIIMRLVAKALAASFRGYIEKKLSVL